MNLLIWLGLIYGITQLLTRNDKIIKRDQVLNRIKSRKIISQQMEKWQNINKNDKLGYFLIM